MDQTSPPNQNQPTPPSQQTPPPQSMPPSQQPSQPVVSQTPPTVPPQPGNKNNKGLIIGIVAGILLLLAVGAVIYIQSANNKPPTVAVTPTPVVQETPVPTQVPAVTEVQEVDNVDTGASESSDLQDVQTDINGL